ncbi:hypothetical protein MTO96_019733 [Rhipicephalus appendiculatus]
MEESSGKTKLPQSVELCVASSGDTFLVTRDSIAAVDKLSLRLDHALRFDQNIKDSVTHFTSGTKPPRFSCRDTDFGCGRRAGVLEYHCRTFEISQLS